MNSVSKLFTAVILVLALVGVSSCKKTFDQPPGPADPSIVPNMTIAQFKAMHTVFGKLDMITDDIVISGVVIADDKSGNLYKQLFIADSTGALQILLDVASLYGSYPVGRKLFIKCKDLCLTDYNRTMQLGVRAYVSGAPSSQAIPANLISNYVIGGSLNNPVVPTVVTLAQLGGSSVDMQNKYLGALIQLNDYEFANTLNTFADTSAYKKDTNDTLQNCSASKIILRSSGYAKFAGQRVPGGHGSIAAIYTVFQSSGTGTKQLILRDTADIHFTNARCTTSGGGGGGGGNAGTGNLLTENFESQDTTFGNRTVTITGWMNSSESGTQKFTTNYFGTPVNKYAQVTAFRSNEATVTSWLVTKEISTGSFATKTLNFDTKAGFTNGATLKVLISTNYTGTGNPWAGSVTWTDLTSLAALSPGSATGYPSSYTPSGNVDISSYSGNIYIAFKYEGADPTGTTSDKSSTWQLDNIKVSGN